MRITPFIKVWERRMNGIYVPKASFFHHLAALRLGGNAEEVVGIIRGAVNDGRDELSMLINAGKYKGSDGNGDR